jgi:NAD(P)-dependent dehydrogenase (short-subunit alcohol dehydrogenase family)
MEREFSGKVAYVTGTSGMGEAAALRLAAGGASVYAVGIDTAANHRLEAAARERGLTVAVAAGDVSKEADVARTVEDCARRFGGIDIIANCAGVQTYGTAVTTRPEDWDLVMNVNVKAMYLTGHFGIPHMVRRGGGAIVHISSVQGHRCQRNVAGYAASKGAVHALTRSMALDHAAEGIRVNSVSPGSIRTPMLEFAARVLVGEGPALEDKIAEFGAAHPLGRVGTAAEVAELIAFLAGPRSGFCTGSDFLVDGGLSAGIGV